MNQPGYHFILTKCGTCKRPLLIEYWVNGSNHTIGTTVVCAECVVYPFPADFEKEHSKEAAEIKAWVQKCKDEAQAAKMLKTEDLKQRD